MVGSIDRSTRIEPNSTARHGRDVMVAFGELELAEKIGSGAAGSVWRGSWRGAAVAVKVKGSYG